MNYASPEALRAARQIVDSDRVLRVFAAPEWDELSDDGKLWISAIVDEARGRPEPAPKVPKRSQCHGNVKPAPFGITAATRALGGEKVGRCAGVVQVPLLPIRLVDQPRRSDDPRLSRANDNGGRA